MVWSVTDLEPQQGSPVRTSNTSLITPPMSEKRPSKRGDVLVQVHVDMMVQWRDGMYLSHLLSPKVGLLKNRPHEGRNVSFLSGRIPNAWNLAGVH